MGIEANFMGRWRAVAWPAVSLTVATIVALAVPGCHRNPEVELTNPTAAPPRIETIEFRASSAAPRQVKVVEAESDSVYVRVQSGDDPSYYVHRHFVRDDGDHQVMVPINEMFDKNESEEYYFSLKELTRVRDKIPGLFMTYPSGRRVIAGWKTPTPFEYRGEMAWPVYECLRADCPAPKENDEHGALFILPDERLTPGADLVTIEKQRDRKESDPTGPTAEEKLAAAQYMCPHCRVLGKPSPEEAIRQEFRRYRLPEAEAMWQVLDEEYTRSRAVRVRKFGSGERP